MDLNKIAVVDYHDYISGDPKKRENFIKDFGDSFANMGFAIVRNHGVTPELRNKLFEVSKAFFNLPEDVKRQYENLALHGQRGYISKNRETAKGKSVADLKEFYHVGQT
ncbi:MAG: 2-oxoglutarate and iron-dependent oxygenase domain-containing protein, partial [Crocinitomicaceae bacterium]|nr:2-oxoglutarate and iron-dependent oxygenase domain-containing protein [Crocinitomicaceae bacterium]